MKTLTHILVERIEELEEEVKLLRARGDEWRVKEHGLREALERLLSDIETNSEDGAPEWAWQALNGG